MNDAVSLGLLVWEWKNNKNVVYQWVNKNESFRMLVNEINNYIFDLSIQIADKTGADIEVIKVLSKLSLLLSTTGIDKDDLSLSNLSEQGLSAAIEVISEVIKPYMLNTGLAAYLSLSNILPKGAR
ncbi:MAG: hypothetical protein M1419_08700 [Bacteroidetes bacterium]|nr:hypothetical protein [Bacteroidota bacterium]